MAFRIAARPAHEYHNSIETEYIDDNDFKLLDTLIAQAEQATASLPTAIKSEPVHESCPLSQESTSSRSSISTTDGWELSSHQDPPAEKDVKTEPNSTPSHTTSSSKISPKIEELILGEDEFEALDSLLRDAESSVVKDNPTIPTTSSYETSPEPDLGIASRLRARKRPPRTPSPPRKKARTALPTPDTTPTKRSTKRWSSADFSQSSSPPASVDSSKLQSVVKKLFEDEISTVESDSKPKNEQPARETNLPYPDNTTPLTINRSPILCLWAAVVAERQGYSWKESLSLGKGLQQT
ncbi:hypothetical protein HK097_002367, partial [Rhizophlyctis rosea]